MSQGDVLKFCTVCASNNNRSMEAHKVLKENGFLVRSYGTGTAVRLPGPSIDKPNVFQFGTPYTKIMEVLNSQDIRIHKSNGVLAMTERNMKIKKAPERWPYYDQTKEGIKEGEQKEEEDEGVDGYNEHEGFESGLDFNVVFTCEERCFDAVVEDFMSRAYFEPNSNQKKVHVFNIEIRDDHESAGVGGGAILELATLLKDSYLSTRGEDTDQFSTPFEDRIIDIMSEWQQKYPKLPILYSLCFH